LLREFDVGPRRSDTSRVAVHEPLNTECHGTGFVIARNRRTAPRAGCDHRVRSRVRRRAAPVGVGFGRYQRRGSRIDPLTLAVGPLRRDVDLRRRLRSPRRRAPATDTVPAGHTLRTDRRDHRGDGSRDPPLPDAVRIQEDTPRRRRTWIRWTDARWTGARAGPQTIPSPSPPFRPAVTAGSREARGDLARYRRASARAHPPPQPRPAVQRRGRRRSGRPLRIGSAYSPRPTTRSTYDPSADTCHV
jgi:hypothetical protein